MRIRNVTKHVKAAACYQGLTVQADMICSRPWWDIERLSVSAGRIDRVLQRGIVVSSPVTSGSKRSRLNVHKVGITELRSRLCCSQHQDSGENQAQAGP